MNRLIKSGFLFLLGFVILAWFIYSLNQPVAPSETYMVDRVMDVVKLIGAVAGLVGGIVELVRR